MKLPFGMVSGVGSVECVLYGCGHWHHLANIIEQLCTVALPPGW